MAQSFPIRGNIPAVVTPFDAEGRLLVDSFETLVRWHIDQGADGICVAGDNGESWTLSIEERRLLASRAVAAAGGRVPVAMGASATTARQSIAYAEAVADTGVTALMVGPQPYVMKATTAELVARFEAIHRAVPLPIVLYNSPRRTGISLTLETMRAITEAVPVVALKEATRDFFYLSHVIHQFRDRLAVLVGPAPFILPGLQLGAAGFISSGPELLVGRAARLMGYADRKLDAAARELQEALTRLYEALMATGTWPAALKAGHTLIGLPGGVPREPVMPLDEAETMRLAALLRELGVETHEVARRKVA
ncbi:dihydrodipicolinate synthase family protein [Elioraea sp.]|uniref:dihydrodipicolinate synthase family protein n=1 Tax=Elioraea sp. TaxID=2185103 RepID=UPI003F6EA089